VTTSIGNLCVASLSCGLAPHLQLRSGAQEKAGNPRAIMAPGHQRNDVTDISRIL